MSKPVILLDAGQLIGLSGTTAGDVLTWNGTEWVAQAGGGGTGTVTSVALATGLTGLTVSGGTSQTITGSGTFTLGGTLGAGYGGTGLGAPASGDAGKVLTATSGGGYELAMPAPDGVTSITAGAGLDGGVITSTGTISMPNVGTPGTVGNVAKTPSITTDSQGRVTTVTLSNIQIAQSQVDNLTTALSGKVSTSTQVIAGTGLSGGGALSGNVTLSLGSVGTEKTDQGSASKTVTLTTDAYGRVTALSEQSIAIAGSQITSGTVALANGGTGKDFSGITAGEVIVGQVGGGTVDAVTISQDATLGADGALTVVGLQGRPLSSSAPIPGQSLVWSSAGGGTWVPGDTASGGSGGGGVVYFMNAGTSRSGGGLPAGSYQLGRTAQTSSTPITITNVPTSAWTRVAGFVTDAGDPTIGQLPAGIWDFNVYATSTANANDMLFRLSFYEYNGSTDPELGSPIATTLSTSIYDPSAAVQYQATFNIPQTPFTSKRIYLKLEAFTSASGKNVTFDFGNSYASHVHTTVPSVTGSGFVKVLNDVIVSTGQLVNLGDSADVGSSILGVGNGGTGANSLTQHAVLVGNGTNAVTAYALADGQVLIGQTGGAPAAATLTAGTGVGITNGTNSIQIAIGQAVGTTDSPTFANITDNGLSASQYVKTNSSKQLVSSSTVAAADLSGTVAIDNGGTGAATTSQRYAFIGPALGTGAPSFRPLVAADVSDLSSNAVTSIAGTTDQVVASASTGAVTLSLPQSIGTSSAPTFSGLTLSGLTGYLKGNGGSALTASTNIPAGDLSGQVALDKGGTNANLTAIAGGVVYSDASAFGITAAGTTGQPLVSNGASAPAFGTIGGAAFGSQTANTVLAAPNGSAGNPSFRALVAADIPSLSSIYLPLAGGTMDAGSKLTIAASTATTAGLRITSGLVPNTLASGDIWFTSGGLFISQSGVTGQFITSSPVNNVSVQPVSTPGAYTMTLTGGTNSTASGTGGAFTIAAGQGGTGGTGGALTLRGGAAGSGGANGAISIGATNTASVGIGAPGVTTTFGGRVVTPALTTSAAGFNITPTAATPTTLANGDMWATSANLFVRINGATQTLAPLDSPTFTGTPAAPTATAGTNTTQIATTAFVTTAVAASSGSPYDVSGEAAGTLALNDEIWHFVATRAFTLSTTTTNHKAGAVIAPSGTCVITVYKNNTSTAVFTITYTASATGVIGTVSNNTVAAGDLLFAKITSGPSTISNPYWTFFGTL